MVTAVVGVMSSITIPNMVHWAQHAVNHDFQTIVVSGMREARSIAVAEQKQVYIELDTPNEQLLVIVDDDRDGLFETSETTAYDYELAGDELLSGLYSHTGVFEIDGTFATSNDHWYVVAQSDSMDRRGVIVFASGFIDSWKY